MQALLADVSIPWGDWVASGLGAIQPVVTLALTGVATWLMAAYVPSWITAFAGDAVQRRVNQVLEKAVQSALAQTASAVSGQKLTVPIASTVLARAAQYAVDQAPDLIVHATHDSVANLMKMLLARMEALGVSPDAFDVTQAQEAVKEVVVTQKTKDGTTASHFDFQGTISSALSGKSG